MKTEILEKQKKAIEHLIEINSDDTMKEFMVKASGENGIDFLLDYIEELVAALQETKDNTEKNFLNNFIGKLHVLVTFKGHELEQLNSVKK